MRPDLLYAFSNRSSGAELDRDGECLLGDVIRELESSSSAIQSRILSVISPAVLAQQLDVADQVVAARFEPELLVKPRR